MSFKHIKKLVFSSLHDKKTRNSADFTVNFANSDFSHGHIAGMLMVDMVIPHRFQNVYEENRYIRVIDGFVIYDIDMPLGQYTAVQYMDELTLQIAAISGGALTLTSYAIDPVTGFLSLVWGTPFVVISGSGMTEAQRRLLGINHSSVFGQPQFEAPVDFSGLSTILLKTDLMAANTTMGVDNKHTTIVDMISLADVCYGETKHHFVRTEGVRFHSFAANVTLQDIHFQLTDIHGRQLILPPNQEVNVHLEIVVNAGA